MRLKGKRTRTAHLLFAGVGAAALLAAGGSTGAGAAKAFAASNLQSAPRLEPCKLLTDAQVKSVVPDLAGSLVTSNGESLMKTIETYQCSHVNAAAEGLLVIINIAADAASFTRIKGSERQLAAAKKLDIGDASWLYAKDGGLTVTVHKGRTIIDLQLNTKDAAQKGAVLVELARAVAAKVR